MRPLKPRKNFTWSFSPRCSVLAGRQYPSPISVGCHRRVERGAPLSVVTVGSSLVLVFSFDQLSVCCYTWLRGSFVVVWHLYFLLVFSLISYMHGFSSYSAVFLPTPLHFNFINLKEYRVSAEGHKPTIRLLTILTGLVSRGFFPTYTDTSIYKFCPTF